jgi:hypothetical protein
MKISKPSKATKKNHSSKEASSLKSFFKKGLLVLLAVFLVFQIGFVMYTNDVLDDLSRQSAVSSMGQSVVSTVWDTTRPAPIDPKTGDMYFPEAKHYLPAEIGSSPVVYSYSEDEAGPILRISTKEAISIFEARVLSAYDIDEVFLFLPRLQACARGVQLFGSAEQAQDYGVNWLEDEIMVGEKTYFMYTEPSCPHLTNVVERVRKLQPYQ